MERKSLKSFNDKSSTAAEVKVNAYNMESQTGIPAHKILKSLGLATVYESKALTLDLALSEFTNAPIFSAKREGALKRLNWFLLQAIKATSSYEGLIDLCSKCPSDSEAEKAAITKLAKTFF